MTHDRNVVEFPVEVGSSAEEKNRRVMIEATRLATLSPGEWKLWLNPSAEQLGVAPATLEKVICAIIKDREKKDRESKAEARRQEARSERERKRLDVSRSASKNASKTGWRKRLNAKAGRKPKHLLPASSFRVSSMSDCSRNWRSGSTRTLPPFAMSSQIFAARIAASLPKWTPLSRGPNRSR
jgi:hypothetical protein